MRLDRLTRGQTIAGVSAIALVIFMFFPWYGRSARQDQEFGVNATAWRVFDSLDILLLGIVAIVLAGLWVHASGSDAIRQPLGDAVVAGLGLLAAVLLFYNLIEPPFELDRKYGVYLGLLAAIGVTAGGWISLRDRGESVTSLRRRVDRSVDEARSDLADAISSDRRSSGSGRASSRRRGHRGGNQRGGSQRSSSRG